MHHSDQGMKLISAARGKSSQGTFLGRTPLSVLPLKHTTTLTHGLIRVLGDDDSASGEWDPGLDASELIKGLEMMMRLRIFDDRMIKMQRTGKLSFLSLIHI